METIEAQAPAGANEVEKRIAHDVVQFNPAEAKLAHFADYLTYRINGPQDADGIKMVGEARKEVKRERVALEKLRKQFVEDAVKYQNGINTEARRIRERLEEIEGHLKDEEAKVEAWKQQEREAQARAAQQRIDDRKQALFNLGHTWNGSVYVHPTGAGTVSEDEVLGLDDGPWQELLDLTTGVVNEAKRLAQERENERLAKEAAAEAEAKRLEDERRAIEAERAKMRATVLNARKAVLKAEGLEGRIDDDLLIGMEEGRFSRWVEAEKQAIATAKEEMRLNVRIRSLELVGYRREGDVITGPGDLLERDVPVTEIANASDEDLASMIEKGQAYTQEQARKEGERQAILAAQKAAKEEAEKEAMRKEAMSDREKWDTWVETIRGTAPEMKSVAGKNAVARVLAGLDKMTNDFDTNAQ